MTLDPERQAQLNALCHCYAVLLEAFDSLEDAAESLTEWTGYTLVSECFDAATQSLGRNPPRHFDLPYLCHDYAKRVEGFLVGLLGSDSPLLGSYVEYRKAVETSIPTDPVDLDTYLKFGKSLSERCYASIMPSDSCNLTRSVRPLSIEVESPGHHSVESTPQKNGALSQVTFYFEPAKFDFKSYVNLPFWCFHEFLSHIHSGPLLGEFEVHKQVFEDGWLLYLALEVYRDGWNDDARLHSHHHRHRSHYAAQYLRDVTADANMDWWVSRGYELALDFESAAGRDVFRRVSLQVAAAPWDYFPGMIGGLHHEFTRFADRWLGRLKTKSDREKKTVIERLALISAQPNPVRDLFEFLITA